MSEQLDEKLKEIEEYQFITPKEQLGYLEEYIIIKLGKPNNLLLNYSLSNNLEDIKIAIYIRTGLDINLEKAKWFFNPRIPISVKHLMNKHKVSYSMTTYYEKTFRIININMRVGDKWFYTCYGEKEGKCYPWDYYDTLEKVKRFLRNNEDKFKSDNREDEDDDD